MSPRKLAFVTGSALVVNFAGQIDEFCGINDMIDMTRGADWAIVTPCTPILSGKVPCRA